MQWGQAHLAEKSETRIENALGCLVVCFVMTASLAQQSSSHRF